MAVVASVGVVAVVASVGSVAVVAPVACVGSVAGVETVASVLRGAWGAWKAYGFIRFALMGCISAPPSRRGNPPKNVKSLFSMSVPSV